MTMLLELPDDLMGAVERRAARDGRDVATAVADLIRKGLEVTESLPEKVGNLVRDPVTGLLMAVCKPSAPVESMTIDEILAMEYDTLLQEDMERYGLPLRHEPVDRVDVSQPSASPRSAS